MAKPYTCPVLTPLHNLLNNRSTASLHQQIDGGRGLRVLAFTPLLSPWASRSFSHSCYPCRVQNFYILSWSNQ